MPARTFAVLAIVLGWIASAAAQDVSRVDIFHFREEDYPFTLFAPAPRLKKLIAKSDFVVVGRVVRTEKTGEFTGVSDIELGEVVKPHRTLEGLKVLRYEEYLRGADKVKAPLACIAFGSLNDGKLSGTLEAGDLLDYVKALHKASPDDGGVESMRFYFAYLNHPNRTIAEDAFDYFGRMRDKALGEFGKTCSPAELRALIRLGGGLEEVCGFLLGHCGDRKDAAFLRRRLDERKKDEKDFVRGMLAGYVLLDPAESAKLLLAHAKDSRSDNFRARYSAYAAARSVHAHWPRALGRDTFLNLQSHFLDNPDMADFAADALRQRKYWDFTERVLAMPGRKGYTFATNQRAALRYALVCPDPKAAKFVAEQRRLKADAVKEAEEWLKAQGER